VTPPAIVKSFVLQEFGKNSRLLLCIPRNLGTGITEFHLNQVQVIGKT
jgi:hypothetical protein